MMNIAVIFAGGVGSRMHSKERPKQFLEMNCDKFVGWISAKAPERIEASNKMTSWKRRKNYDEILAVSFLRGVG